MGGVTFEDCKNLVTFAGQPVISIHQSSDGAFLLNAEIFNEAGKPTNLVRDNVPASNAVIFTQNGNEIILSDKYTNRKFCQLVSRKSADGKQVEVEVTLNLFLPNGTMLQCTPSASNQTVLETMRGTTVKNRESALQING